MINSSSDLIEISNSYIRYAQNLYSQGALDELLSSENLIRKVVVILSPPRGGSSLLYKLMLTMAEFISLDGEQTPYYKMSEACFPYSNTTSDQITPGNLEKIDVAGLRAKIIKDTRVLVPIGNAMTEEYLAFLSRKLALQWPSFSLSCDDWNAISYKVYRKYWDTHASWDLRLFYGDLMVFLHELDYPTNLFYYDVPQNFVLEHFKGFQYPQGPPDAWFCLEEPPFVMTHPCRKPGPAEFSSKPLLLKTSTDAYRLPLIHKLFPKADIKFIYLTRNPAASVNGLIDGWLDRGFFSHNIRDYTALNISGYSDLFEWGNCWWKFDLPPQWDTVTNKSLIEVCAFQWKSSHKAILDFKNLRQKGMAQNGILQIKFEDLLGTFEKRIELFRKIFEFCGVEILQKQFDNLLNLPEVMVTSPPQRARWLYRKDKISPILQRDDTIREITEQLGYHFHEVEKWI